MLGCKRRIWHVSNINWVGRPVDNEPNWPVPQAPFKTKRDSCERDRFVGMLLKKWKDKMNSSFVRKKFRFYWSDGDVCWWLCVVVNGCWRRFCRSSFVTLFVRFNESRLIVGDGNDCWWELDLLFVDERPKK